MARFPLKRKHVVITGASDGIGRALAIDLAGRGARITLSARSRDKLAAAEREIAAGGGDAVVVPADVSDEGECRALVGQAIAAHAMQGFFDSLRIDLAGAVDVLVVSPGAVATNIHRLHTTASKRISDESIARRAMPVTECARLIRAAIEARRRDLVMTSAGRLAVRLYPFWPGFVDAQIVKANRRFYDSWH